MNKLTDLEICKRIAEIEKLPHHLEEGMNDKFINTSTIYGDVCEYNPLTDDALCFQLLKKYNIDLISPYLPNNDTQYEAQIFISGIADVLSEYDDSANKAICLAIIEAHKGIN